MFVREVLCYFLAVNVSVSPVKLQCVPEPYHLSSVGYKTFKKTFKLFVHFHIRQYSKFVLLFFCRSVNFSEFNFILILPISNWKCVLHPVCYLNLNVIN